MKYLFASLLILTIVIISGCTQASLQTTQEIEQITKAAAENKDIQKCEEITIVARDGGGWDRDNCYHNYAFVHQDVSACDKISSGGNKAECKIHIASIIGNENICNALTEEDITNYDLANTLAHAKNICFANVATEHKKISVCDMYLPDPDNEIPIETAKEQCKDNIKTTCEYYLNSTSTDETTQTFKQRCLENYVGPGS